MARRSIYTKELGELIAKAARDIYPPTYHVSTLHVTKWAVVQKGKFRALRLFSTQKAAKAFAMQLAISKSAKEVVIHNRDGSVRERILY